MSELKSMRKILQILGCLLLYLLAPAYGQDQDELLYPNPPASAERDARFTEARELTSRHDFDGALEILLQLADENSGNSAGGSALVSAITVSFYKGDFERVEILRSRVYAEYPGSYFEFTTRLGAIDSVEPNTLVEQRNAIIASYGLPPIEEILTGDPELALGKVRSVRLEIREAAVSIYGGFISNRSNNGLVDEAMKIATFGRKAFDSSSDPHNAFGSQVRFLRRRVSGDYSLGGEPGQPAISYTLPEDGGTSPSEAKVEVAFLSGATPQQGGLDLRELAFTIDGQDVTDSVQIMSDTNLASTDEPLETIKVSWQGELAAGTHIASASIKAAPDPEDPPEGPASVSITWSFIVTTTTQPSQTTLNVQRDSHLTQKHPHQNEGANPLLTLEKIQGKASRCAVAFDLANENINGLTKATLVLNIDPSSHVTGWGNGETVSAQALSADWVEGNGKSFGFKKQDVVAGSGSGTTWFSPVDENISNGSANSASSWNGAGQAALPATAPPVIVTNHSSGTLEFDVTADVLNGADSWLILKDQENRGSQISFFSKESGEDVAPKLILDFGDQVAGNSSNSNSLLSRLGFGSHNLKLKAEPRGSERPTFREVLQQNPSVAWAGGGLIGLASGPNPVLSHASQAAYRAWLG
jgi:hypothetical protein